MTLHCGPTGGAYFGILHLAGRRGCRQRGAYGWGGRKGLLVCLAGGIVLAIFAGAQSSNTATMLAYAIGFGAPVILVVVALGAWTGDQIRERNYLLALLPIGLIAAGVWHDHYTKEKVQAEKHLVADFMFHNPQLARLTGGQLRLARGGTEPLNADPVAARYAYLLDVEPKLYAIIDVNRETSPAGVRLRCVTQNRRLDPQTDPCATGAIALDDPRFAVAPEAAASKALSDIPQVPTIPNDAHVHVIGVYEAKNRPRSAPGSHEAGDIVVTVAADKAPLLLVLTSYEPVRWEIRNLGRPISAVFTSGYYPSTVTGTHAPVANIGRDFLSDMRGSEEAFRTRMRAHTKGPFKAQETYYGTAFTVPKD